MNRTPLSLWLALALGSLALGCSKDATTVPTDPTITLDRGGNKDGDNGTVTYAVIGDVPYTDSKLNGGPSLPTLIAAINEDVDVEQR